MATYSILNQATPSGVSYGGLVATAGTMFTLSQPAALTGIWFYSAPSDTALPSACGIWDVNSQTVVSGTLNSSPSWSGALGSGWVKCTYDGSVTLKAWDNGLVVAVQYNGNKGYAYPEGYPITSGPITAPKANVHGTTNAPYLNGSSFSFPTTGSSGVDWFVDVEVSVASYIPYYLLHNQSVATYSVQTDTVPYTLGVQFAVSVPCKLTGIWFLTPANGTLLPDSCVIFNADTQAQVPGSLNSSPSWSNAEAGTGGWARCGYDGSVTLQPGVHYDAAVFAADAGAAEWFAGSGGFWFSGGGGASGITNGPLSAPNNAGALHGQAPYNTSGSLAFPNISFSNFDWGIDVEVTPVASGSGLLMASFP